MTPVSCAALFLAAGHLADDELHRIGVAQLVHLRDGGGRRLEAVAAMDQDDALGLVGAFRGEIQRPVQRRVAAAHHHQVLAGELGRVLHAIVDLGSLELLEAVHLERARLEGAHAGGDEDRAGEETRAPGGLDEEAPIRLARHRGDFLAEVKGGAEGFDLPQQAVGQLLAGAHGHGGNVIDRLVGIELDALAAGIAERVDHMGLDLQQAELEHLEQAHRAGAHDDGIGLDRAIVRGCGPDHFLVQLGFHTACGFTSLSRPPDEGRLEGFQRTSSLSLSGLSFHSSASSRAGLRLVMLFQAGASSALSLMKAIWSEGTSSSA